MNLLFFTVEPIFQYFTFSGHVRNRARSKRSMDTSSFSPNPDHRQEVAPDAWNVTVTSHIAETPQDQHLTFNKEMQPQIGSKQQDEAFNKLTALVEKLEKQVGHLEAEVHRLEGKLGAQEDLD